jgi:hypothetical protein
MSPLRRIWRTTTVIHESGSGRCRTEVLACARKLLYADRQHVLSGRSEGSRTDDDRTPAGTAIFDARKIGSATRGVRHRL